METSMLWIIISVIFLILFIPMVISVIEPRMPEFTTIKLNDKDPSLRILFFSDVHVDMCFVPAEYICARIREASKTGLDAVVFGGDVSGDPAKIDKGIVYMRKIADCCASLNIPFLGVTGNHDTDMTDGQAAACGFISLEGSSYELGDFVFTGVDDSGREERHWFDPLPVPTDKINIFVAHTPDAILHVSDASHIRYMLSGHIHGGQIRTPIGFEFKLRKTDVLPAQGIFKGVHTVGNTKIFISRGIGCVKMPLRLGSRPEVSIVEL